MVLATVLVILGGLIAGLTNRTDYFANRGESIAMGITASFVIFLGMHLNTDHVIFDVNVSHDVAQSIGILMLAWALVWPIALAFILATIVKTWGTDPEPI